MATIITTEIQVFTGTTATTQVGSTITSQGSPSTVTLDNSTLGAYLSPGEQYCTRARCTNDESYTTDWTSPYPFKTLILAEITTVSGGAGNISPELSFTYNSNVLTNTECGVYVSTNSSGSNATKIPASDQQEAEQGWVITGLTENTTYYVIPYVIDDLGREYKGAWAEAETVNTGYSAPTVTITNIATTYNSITGNVNVSSNTTLSEVYLTIRPTGGGNSSRINLTAATGLQTFTITDGMNDYQGNPITISPSTEYRITVYATNAGAGGATGNAQATATTAAQSQATIAITGIDQITPTGARVLLSYGGGGAQINPGQNE